MHRKVTKAIFPVTGTGTRFLPATKSIPKEIMTLVERPLIQYAIDEARAAGITDFIFVTACGKEALEDYFDRAPHLESEQRSRGKYDLSEILQHFNIDSGEIAYVLQYQLLGLGHAVWCARRLIADESFAVILPDDVIMGQKPCLQQMVEAFEETGGNIVAAKQVPAEHTSRYGILDCDHSLSWLRPLEGLVEKPSAGTAPSNLAVIGRYILTPKVLENLNALRVGRYLEVQITDADHLRPAGPKLCWISAAKTQKWGNEPRQSIHIQL